MKTLLSSLHGSTFLSLLLVSRICCLAQSDDFNDGNDAGWVRFNPLSVVGTTPTYSFPNDSFGGRAYRIQSPAPPVPNAGPARAFTYRTNVYSQLNAAVDIATFDNTLNQAFGILFRAENIGLGKTTGYVLNYDPQQASGGRGQIQINIVTGEQDAGTIGSANLTLDPGRHYRFVLSGNGNDFFARVYDLNDLTLPISSFQASDPLYPQGITGLFNFYRGGAVTDPSAGRADSTFDNYDAATLAPPATAPGIRHPIPDYPQVIERTPVSRANFFAASNGLTFRVATYSGPPIDTNATRLFLNGASIPVALQPVSGNTNVLQGSYAGLLPNNVYDGKIIVADTSGRVSTNEWTFDTFSEAFLQSSSVKVIEAEDYNYAGGSFQNNPPPSGIDTNGTPINGGGVGYYDLAGVPDVDYFDRASNPGGGTALYRTTDFVGTQNGSSETAANSVADPVVNDTTRAQYGARGLTEYQVTRTEGGEWLNYTRVFSNGSYRVYLRVAARAAQDVYLERVDSDPGQTNQITTLLGTFHVPNTGMTINYRFVPLVDTNGNPVQISLQGTNTVRLVMGGPAQPATQHVMALNYFVFAPAPMGLQLQSSSSVATGYTAETGASIDPGTRTITLARPSATRFYRLQSDVPLRIQTIGLAGGNLVIKYDVAN